MGSRNLTGRSLFQVLQQNLAGNVNFAGTEFQNNFDFLRGTERYYWLTEVDITLGPNPGGAITDRTWEIQKVWADGTTQTLRDSGGTSGVVDVIIHGDASLCTLAPGDRIEVVTQGTVSDPRARLYLSEA